MSPTLIRDLNDHFRRTFPLGGSGRVLITRGVSSLPEDDQAWVLLAVRHFDAFTPDNDPHGEHDFGAFAWKDVRYFWKIDYYDRTMTAASPNAADPLVTTRVLTIMRADEY